MSFNEISKKLVKLNTRKTIIQTAIISLIIGGMVTQSLIPTFVFSIVYSVLMLVLLHVILVLKVKRKLRTCDQKHVYYCQNKKSALMIESFLLVEEADKIVVVPFDHVAFDLTTKFTIEMIKNKDNITIDGKGYHLIELL